MPRLAAVPLHCRFCNSRVCALCVVRCALCVVRCRVVRCALCVDANRIHLWFLRLWFVRFIIPHLSNLSHFAVIPQQAVGALLLSNDANNFFRTMVWRRLFVCMAAMLFFGTARQVVQPPVKVGNAFWQGLALQLANPKTILFFIAFLPLFVDADKPAGSQMIVLAAASFVVEFFVLFVYAKIATISAQLTAPRFRKHLHRTAALILITAAISLLLLQDN